MFFAAFGNPPLLTRQIQVKFLSPFSCSTGELLQDSERQELRYQDREASLTVPCAHKEDEGFYTIRVPSLDGYKEQTTYVFVRGIYRTYRSPFLMPWHKGIPTLTQKEIAPNFEHGYNYHHDQILFSVVISVLENRICITGIGPWTLKI